MSQRLSERLTEYVLSGMKELESKGVKFDSTDGVLWQIEATSRSAGLGTPSFTKVDPDGHLRVVSVMFSRDLIVSPAGTNGWYIRFKSRMNWEENSPPCTFKIEIDVLNAPDQEYMCGDFVSGRSATQFDKAFENVVRKMLVQAAARDTAR